MIVDLPTLESFLVTFIVATIRTLVEASPTILGGVVVAAWLRTQATPEKVASIFWGDGIQGSLRTVLVGMAMPVCAIGVLPVLRELKQLGLPTSKLIALGLSAPLLNPFSLLFGLTVLSFPFYLLLIALTGILAIVVGEVSERFASRKQVTALPRPAGLTGGTRMRNLLIASSRMVTGRTILDLIIAIVFTVLTLAFIRAGAFLLLCEPANSKGPAVAAILTLTQYVSPPRAIVQLGGIEDSSLSLATGLAIYVFGTAICGATILTFLQKLGLRRMIAIAISLFLVVGAVSYLTQYVSPQPSEVAETDALCNLMRPNYATLQQLDKAFYESIAFFNMFMYFGSGAMILLAITGLFVRIAKMDFRDDDPEAAAELNAGRMSKALPASQLGAVAVSLIGIFLFVSAYMFFPGPDVMMEEMDRLQLDSGIEVQTGNANAAMERLAAWDSVAASVPIGAAIRGSFPTPVQREMTRDLRAEIRNLRNLLVEGELGSAKKSLPKLKLKLSEIKQAFAGEGK